MSHKFTANPISVFQCGEKGVTTDIFGPYQNFFTSLSSELCGSARVVLGFFFHFEEFLRQALAIGAVFLSLPYENKPTKNCAQYMTKDLSNFVHGFAQDLP